MKKQKIKIDKGFGKRLRKARKAAGLTQKALGTAAGINPVSIAQYETGVCNPSEKSAEKIMAFFKRREERGEVEHPPNCRCVLHPGPKSGQVKLTRKEAKFEKARPFDLKKVGVVMKRLADPSDPFPGTPLLLGHVKAAKPREIKKARRIIEDEVKEMARGAQHEGAQLSKTPARLGMVDRSWIEQQIDSHVRSYGYLISEGPVSIVIMKKAELVGLCRLMLQVGGVQVGGE